MEPASDWSSSLCSRTLHEVESKIELLLGMVGSPGASNSVLLDVGCWDGAQTEKRAEALNARRLLGIEIFEGPATAAAERGIEVARIDLESERFPWPDESVDVVVCNQVLEHLKNIWLPMSEMHRVLRPGGYAVLSVPNLASLHNRVLLALGRQPTSIRVLGPHVRGYTFREFCDLVELDGAYTIEHKRGAGFYPVPSPWSAPLSTLWRSASHTIVVLARKQSNREAWSEYLSQEVEGGAQTFYPADLRRGAS